MRYMNEDKAHEMYEQMIDECSDGPFRIGYLEFLPSEVLKNLDPVAYRCGFNDWCDSENITTDEDEADPEEEEEEED